MGKADPKKPLAMMQRSDFYELADLAREATRQNPVADPMKIGKFWAHLAFLEASIMPNAWRLEIWQGGTEEDLTAKHRITDIARAPDGIRYRLLVAGVGLVHEPMSFAEARGIPGLHRANTRPDKILRAFFSRAEASASIVVAPWRPYVATYPAPGWTWMPQEGDAQ